MGKTVVVGLAVVDLRADPQVGAAAERIEGHLTAEIVSDPHYTARETLVSIHDDELGEVTVPAPVPRMSGTPGRVSHIGPPLGAHTEDVLRDLGFASDEIAAGRAEGSW